MGQRGYPALPTALKIVRGNPSKRPLNKLEPKPQPFRGKPPDILDDEGRKEWRRLVPVLKRMKVLTEADGIALTHLCVAYSTWIKAQRQIAKAGLLYQTHSGYVAPSPLIAISNKAALIVHRYLREFGLTPSSRSGIAASVASMSPQEEWEELDRMKQQIVAEPEEEEAS